MPSLFSPWLAGTQYRTNGGHDMPAVGDRLVCRREPANAHDKTAVAVDTLDGRHVGYVPRVVNAELARRLSVGVAISCVVVETNHQNGCPYVRVDIVDADDDEDESVLHGSILNALAETRGWYAQFGHGPHGRFGGYCPCAKTDAGAVLDLNRASWFLCHGVDSQYEGCDRVPMSDELYAAVKVDGCVKTS